MRGGEYIPLSAPRQTKIILVDLLHPVCAQVSVYEVAELPELIRIAAGREQCGSQLLRSRDAEQLLCPVGKFFQFHVFFSTKKPPARVA